MPVIRATQLIGRLASPGLAAILLALPLLVLLTMTATRDDVAALRVAIRRGDLYQKALYDAVTEMAVQQDDRTQGGRRARARFNIIAGRLEATLHLLSRGGERDDQAVVRQVLAFQRAYRKDAARVLTRDTLSGAHAPGLDDHQWRAIADTIANIIGAAANRVRGQVGAGLARLNDGENTAYSAAVVLSCEFILLGSFWWIQRRHKHRNDKTTHAELLRLEHASLTDHLTGLGNHRAFQEAVPRTLAHASRHGDSAVLALIDIDDFKVLNDQHGHVQGDRTLTKLAAMLRGGRVDDQAFRLGGDEFALILEHSALHDAAAALERLRWTAEQGLAGATISIGLAAPAPGEKDAETLRERADAALYEAKRRGRNAVVTFEDIKDSASILPAAKVNALRRLLAERRLTVAFQPIWNLDCDKILAFEALTRPAPDYGLTGPLEAFDIAERIGRAHDLDAVCREAILSRAVELPPDTLLFMNLSPQALDHDLLADATLITAITAAGLTPDRVVLEVTERSLARLAVVVREAARLRSLGFKLALDDVGAGNAGLEMLRQLPVDFVKIDRDVVAGALTDTSARAVLAAIIAFAREAHSLVVAEGIETEAVLGLVRHVGMSINTTHTAQGGVHAVQGYLLGRPHESLPTISGQGRQGVPTHAA